MTFRGLYHKREKGSQEKIAERRKGIGISEEGSNTHEFVDVGSATAVAAAVDSINYNNEQNSDLISSTKQNEDKDRAKS